MSQLISPDLAPELQGQPPQSDIHSHSSQSQSQSQSTLPSSTMSSQSRPDPNLDPNLSSDPVNPLLQNMASPNGGPPGAPPGLQLGGLDSTQILTLLRHLPGVFNKLAEQGGLKDSAAEQLQQHLAGRPLPGPSSNFTFTTTPGPELPASTTVPQENGKGTKRKRGGKAPGSGDDVEGDDGGEDWTRQRKDNHKEVERRRRGNINEGINELARIVPNGSGEKAKGAILNRAVQYIHHLKENEARNIEKWTLEKLLMDQAMGDLQAQLEDVRRMWDEERQAKERALLELDVIRAGGAVHVPAGAAHPNPYDARDRAYHPSDRHHHIQHAPPHMHPHPHHDPVSDDVDMEHLAQIPPDADVAGVRDPDVVGEGDARGSADPDGAEAEREAAGNHEKAEAEAEAEADVDAEGMEEEERDGQGKRRRVD